MPGAPRLPYGGRLWSVSHHWQTNCKRRSTPRLARDCDVAAHHLTKPFADREPEAGAAIFAGGRCIRLGKLLEQFAHLLRRHADAGISDSDSDPIAGAFLSMPRINGYGAALRKLIRIAHEVEQRLPQPHLIGMQPADRSIATDREAVLVLCRQRLDGFDHAFDEGREREIFELQFHAS